MSLALGLVILNYLFFRKKLEARERFEISEKKYAFSRTQIKKPSETNEKVSFYLADTGFAI
jgi:hypothetical protein